MAPPNTEPLPRMSATIEILYRQAADHLAAGRLGPAAELGAQLLRRAPDHAGGLHLLGFIELQARQPEKAVPLLARSCQRDGTNPTALFHLAMAYTACGLWSNARPVLEKVVALQPNRLEARVKLAEVLEQLGEHFAAIDIYRWLIQANPKDGASHSRLGHCHLLVGDYANAIDSYRAAAELTPDSPAAHYNLSLALRHGNRSSDACDAVAQALALRPNYPAALLNLGILREQQGDLEGAASAYRTVLEILPTCTAAYWSLANLRSVRFSAEESEAMRRLSESGLTGDEDRTYLHFALAKDFEDKRLYREAFEHLAKANALKRGSTPYSRQFVEEQFAGIKETFNATFFAQRAGVGLAAAKPIFIVGMPRSGSSLVEQILASHSHVSGGGELPTAQQIAHRDIRNRYQAPFYAAANQFRPDEFAELGKLYCQRNAELVRAKARFTDKAPDNFILLGLLRLMFPNASFIHARRHPLDTCLSCYKQYFTDAQSFSYDLEDLAHYYRQYRDLMEWWHGELPGTILDVDYEAVVGDQEAQSRRIVEFCQLPWETRCLDFHETRRAVKTASVGQVRQALYASSVHQWKNYEPYVHPLVDALTDLL